MKRSDMTPINGLEDIFELWAKHNKITADYVSCALLAEREEILRGRIVVALNVFSCLFFANLIMLLVTHLFSGYRSVGFCVLSGTGIIDCIFFVWFVVTLFKFYSREKPSSEVARFESDWDRFRALFKIKDLRDYRNAGMLWVHVECSLEEARQIHGLKGPKHQSVFVEMHENALRFDMCNENRFSYEPLSCRAKTPPVP